MSQFLTTHRLHLTPLSPLHIGCGEDFEPTNYVIDDGLLYGFDPSRATLNDLQRRQLTDVARRGSLSGIQRFFRRLKLICQRSHGFIFFLQFLRISRFPLFILHLRGSQ